MNCPTCYGKGFVRSRTHVAEFYPSDERPVLHEVCPDCKGYGIVHCCDGENVDQAVNIWNQ